MSLFPHPHYINLVSRNLRKPFWQMAGRFRARWWRVSLGRGCRFEGLPVFRNLPGSSIVIGDGCQFNSSHTSNLIGVYSPCMIPAIRRGAAVRIGDGCGFSGTVIAAAVSVTLGRNVRCGANTLINDTDWHADDPRSGGAAPVVIGDNVWLGYGVKVMKGVTIGENSVIGACSVVTRDIPANVVAAGVPCRVLHELTDVQKDCVK